MATASGLTAEQTPQELETDSDAVKLKALFQDGPLPPGSLQRAFDAGSKNLERFAESQTAETEVERQLREQRLAAASAEKEAAAVDASVDQKELELEAGSKEEIVEQVSEEGHSFDNNPNNQTKSLDDANTKLFEALGDDSSLTRIAAVLAEDKVNEDISRRDMQKVLADLKARKPGVDFTPLAGLIDDPNKARILAQTLKPGFTDEEKQAQILDVELKLQDRKDDFDKSRSKLKTGLITEERAQSVQLAQAAVNAANIKEQMAARNDAKQTARLAKEMDRQTRHLTDSEKALRSKSRLGKDIESINTLAGMLDKINPDDGGDINNALASSLIRFDLIRTVQPGGVITDKDLDAASASPAILNRVRTLLRTWKEGIVFTRTDQLNIARIMKAAIIAKTRVIKEGLASETSSIESRYRAFDGSHPLKASLLSKEGGQFHIDKFVSPGLRARVDDFLKKSKTVAAGKEFKKEGKSTRRQELEDEKAKLLNGE